MTRLRATIGGAALAATLATTACTDPPPAPVEIAVEWTASTSGDDTYTLTSNAEWYVEVGQTTGGGPEMRIHPRQGPLGDDLGMPQTISAVDISNRAAFLGDQLLLVHGFDVNGSLVRFYREVGGTWSDAGTMGLADAASVVEFSDDTMVTVEDTGAAPIVSVYDIGVVGGVVTPTLETTLSAPASWGPTYAEKFGWSAGHAMEGDVLALSSQDINGFGPGRVAIYRNIAGTWTYEHAITGDVPQFGRSLAIDDQGNKERLAIGATKAPEPGRVDLYRSTLGTWATDGTLNAAPLPAGSDTSGGSLFGSEVALDGNLLVVGSRYESLAPNAAGEARAMGYHQVFHWNGTTWMLETALTTPAPIADPSEELRTLGNVTVHGSHIVATAWGAWTPTPGPTPIIFGLQAWRWDRNLLP